MLLGILWFFYRTLLSRKIGVLRSISRAVTFSLIGVLISAIYLIPLIEFILIAKTTHTASSDLLNYPQLSGNMIHPLWHLPMLVLQVNNFDHSFSLQIRFLALTLLFFSQFNHKEWTEYRSHIIFFSVYSMSLSLLKFDMLVINSIRDFPLLNLINLTKYPTPSIVFCLAVLVGIFIDRIDKHHLSYKKLSLSVLFVVLGFIVFPVLGNPDGSLQIYFSDANKMKVSVGIIIGITIGLYTLVFLQNNGANHKYIQVGFFFLVLCEPFYWGQNSIRPNRIDPFQTPPFVRFLQNDQMPFRIFGFDSILYPNISTAYQIADIRWLNALLPERAGDFTSKFIHSSNELDTIRFTGRFLPISDRMFDLLNVKYVLAKTSKDVSVEECLANPNNNFLHETRVYFEDDTLINSLLLKNSDKEHFQGQRLDINGITKTAIFAHPPNEFELDLSIPDNPSTLDFSVGLNPIVFYEDRSDGVYFQIILMDRGREYGIYSRYITPNSNPCDRMWVNESIRLDRWSGKNVVIKFLTDGGPLGDASWDWAYWGEIRLTTLASKNRLSSSNKYSLVYQDDDVQIYQNKRVFPRSFVVYNVISVPNFESAMDLLSDSQLDLRQTAIVEGITNELINRINQNNKLQSVEGDAKILNTGTLIVQIETQAPGMLIVTDQYYPGWKAYVDGKSTPIYAVNGIFRGVFLEEGSHTVEYKYQPLSVLIGGLLSTISLISVLLFGLANSNHYFSKKKA